MLKIHVRWENGSISEFKIDKDHAVLGRAPDSDVYLPSEQASREHARIYVSGEKVLVEDLESANGTFVKNERIKVPMEIGPQDPIKLGDVFVRASYEENKGLSFSDDSDGYTLAQKLGDRKRTNVIGSDAGAELRRMFEKGEQSSLPKKKK